MSHSTDSGVIYVQDLLTRAVLDADGKKLGRVYDIVAECDGDDLCVTALMVGAGSWLGRFGWKQQEHGKHVSWESIAELHPRIRLRRGVREGG